MLRAALSIPTRLVRESGADRVALNLDGRKVDDGDGVVLVDVLPPPGDKNRPPPLLGELLVSPALRSPVRGVDVSNPSSSSDCQSRTEAGRLRLVRGLLSASRMPIETVLSRPLLSSALKNSVEESVSPGMNGGDG